VEICVSCGAEQGPDARFCANCGAPQHPLRDEQQERRVVTVLFSDLAGSTALVEQIDPEDVRRVQADLFDLLNAEVVRFGGTTEKFVGDAVLAVFGIPLAHEDDPERAVRAALAAHERFPAFAALIEGRYGMSVGLRTGINTGNVVSSRETAARGELIVSGDAVNVAARLQQNARPGEILVGDRTHAATSRAVLYGQRRNVEAKGKSTPVSAWGMFTGSCFWNTHPFMQSLQMRWPVPGSIGLSTQIIASAAIESPSLRSTCISPIFSSSGQPLIFTPSGLRFTAPDLSCMPVEHESFSRSWQ